MARGCLPSTTIPHYAAFDHDFTHKPCIGLQHTWRAHDHQHVVLASLGGYVESACLAAGGCQAARAKSSAHRDDRRRYIRPNRTRHSKAANRAGGSHCAHRRGRCFGSSAVGARTGKQGVSPRHPIGASPSTRMSVRCRSTPSLRHRTGPPAIPPIGCRHD